MDSISALNLGKAYKQYFSRWARLMEWIIPGKRQYHQLHWVLQNINFTVQPGEAVGIVGKNGAGKSTLLKIITGTTQPTMGQFHTSGRVAALLELGMGFHPDFTGRQNVFVAGQLLGHNANEIKRLMPEIEDFAEIGDYIDQPVRTYSSGMQVRVAFAVATAVRPDVLIVDEALAVGDAAFQRKCHRRIQSFIDQGTSLLFVSHNIEGVKKICSKAVYLDHGQMLAFGPAKSVCDQYETDLCTQFDTDLATEQEGEAQAPVAEIEKQPPRTGEILYGTGEAFIERIWIENFEGKKTSLLVSGEDFSVCYIVSFQEYITDPIVAMMIKTVEGVTMYGTHSKLIGKRLGKVLPGSKFQVSFRLKSQLSPGFYFLNCGVSDPLDVGRFLHRRVDVMMFQVTSRFGRTHDGLVNLDAKLYFKNLEDSVSKDGISPRLGEKVVLKPVKTKRH